MVYSSWSFETLDSSMNLVKTESLLCVANKVVITVYLPDRDHIHYLQATYAGMGPGR